MTLKDLLEYFSSLGKSLGEDATRQGQELTNLFRNIVELNFLDISLFHYFVFFMLLLSPLESALSEAKIGDSLRGWGFVLYLILRISMFIFAIYFTWLLLKFGIGVIVNMSM